MELAEAANGPIPRRVGSSYIWGEALADLERAAPDLRIVNLETAVTASDDYWKGKGINYRMHPDNVGCLTAAGIDCCALANNHVLDWGYAGLEETLATLKRIGIAAAGAGRNRAEAEAPAIFELPGRGRVLLFSFGSPSSGIPHEWAATGERAGVSLLSDLSAATADRIGARIAADRRRGDLVVASIHWGGNWGYPIPPAHRAFARHLIDRAGVDLVHGHSSHHPLGIEVHRGKLVLYGCGDFLNDYEGIGGYEEFRRDLVLAYLATLEAGSGRLVALEMAPFRTRRFRLERAAPEEADWLASTLSREGAPLGTRVERGAVGTLELRW